ncbi:hypothetical protein INR49_023041 [Caranx melampygus]|nr:hypothetical protein INR49_023041 [Caranx melampygus]
MPLFIQNRGLDCISATAELFDKYPHLQEHARTFRSRPLVDVDPKCLLYVQQREFAATTPADTAFQKQKEDIHLETCCITEMNDVVVDGNHKPIVYGIGVNVKTGEVFPSSFTHKGPAEELRAARTFTGEQMAEIYDSSRGLVKIGPCKWSPNLDIAFWLSQSDDTILKYLSTSPMAEPPHFVQHMKSTIRFLLEHPNPDSLFPGGQPQFYRRTEMGDWERAVQS